jgi:heme exporter protein C
MTTSDPAARIIARGLRTSVAALLGLAVVYVLAIGFTPIEARQGVAQKIFYLHVPSAWCALLAFSLVGIASALYLWLQDPRLDRFAAATAEVGVAFAAVMLTTGPIWAKPIWGTWWTWDARLTLTLFLFFLFVGYLALRASLHDPA